MHRIHLVLSICLIVNILYGQQPIGIPQNPYGESARDTLFPDQKEVEEISSVDLTYSLLSEPWQNRLEIRDSLNEEFRKYDPADRTLIYHQNLGNTGSPARPGVYTPSLAKGLHTGMNQFNIYQTTPDSLRFYNPKIPLTSILASQGAGQEDGLINVRFGRQFAKGVDVSINYFRINQTGVFQQAQTKNTNVSIGIHQRSASGKLDSYYAYLSNSVVQENSGGIVDYADFADPANSIRAAIPVHLADAITTLRNRYFVMQHHYHLRSNNDSTNENKPLLDISYKLQWNPYSYKFYDNSINGDGDFIVYDGFRNDDRGVRNFISVRKLTNEFGLKFFVAQNNTISGSIEHRSISLNQEPIEETRNEVYINGGIQTRWLKKFDLIGSGYLGLLDASGHFKLKGEATLSFDEYGSLTGHLMTYQRRPFLIEESMFVNQFVAYQENFKNVNINLIGAKYQNANWRVKASANWWVVNNIVYFGTDRKPVQIENATSIRQFTLQKDIVFGPLLILNKVTFQNFSEDKLRLPSLILQESISLNGRIFKQKLQYQIGVDLTMTNTHAGVSYFPLSGQFNINDERMVSSFPAIDAFASFRIKALKVFLKSENINAFFNDKIYDQIIGYPQFESYFRFGFSFQVFN